jgi:hypothetical protein
MIRTQCARKIRPLDFKKFARQFGNRILTHD